MQPSLIILADRGHLKAFQVEETANRSHAPRLVSTLENQEPQQRYAEKLTDQSGGFPNGGSAGQGNSISERISLEAEEEVRSFRRLAEHITQLLEEHRPERWAFAAPSEINGAILDGLAPTWHQRLWKNLPRDLIHSEPSELLGRFDQAT